MKSALPITVLFLLSAMLQAATVNLVQNSVDDATGATITAVSSSQYLDTGVSYSTVTAPATSSTYRFTHWTNSSYPATVYRDAWGRSFNPISFVLLEDTTCTAHYLPATRDTDGDGVPDWYEIEYFGNLSQGATSNIDGDGISLSAEYSGGTHPLYGNSQQAGGVAYADSALVTFNRPTYPTYTLSSVPAGTVNQSAVVPPGTVVTSPDLSANTSFGYWTLDGVRQMDAWGVALPRITFTMASVNREAVAYLFTGDTDGDGVPDAYEQYYYGTLANNQNSDTDGDGISLLAERNGGTNPLYINSHLAGGVSWTDSAMVTVNFVGHSYTITSNPPGTVDQSATVLDGTVITTPEMTQSTFGYWTLDGIPQRDAWGVALRQFSFTVDGSDRAAVAWLFDDDSDGDGINDGFEQYHFGTLANGAASDTDGDGISLLTEYNGGSNPLYANSRQEGGVSWADSAMVVANLQPYERLSKMRIGGVLTDFFSPNPNILSGIQAGTWSSTAVADWDGDGDPDLFIAHESGLRVFRHIGTARNPNFEEITTGFAPLAAFISNIDRPVVAGGDWNDDGLGDLVIGGNTGTLRLIASGGAFSSNASGLDLTIPGTTFTRPAVGDMNGDGRADLLVLLDDGTVSLFLNNGTPVPFSGSGGANFLGTPAPDGTGIAVGDINQDGLPDVLLADTDGRIWEFINNGSGGFSLQSKVWGGSFPGFASGLTLATVDIEGDGDLDLISGLANGGIIALRDPNVGRPTGLIARPGANSVQLDWDPNWQSRIRGYHIYRATAEAGPFAKLLPDIAPLPSYLDSPVDPSMLHYYYVTGVSQFLIPGNSTPRITETLPSDVASSQAGKVILSVRPARGNPGQRIKINLSIENAMGITGNGMQLRVAYDAAKLTPWAQAQSGGETVLTTGLSRNLAFTDNGASATGELVIDGAGGELEPGAGKLFTLQFEVGAGVPINSTLGVTIDSATMHDLNGNALAVEILPQDNAEADDAFIEGDLDGDGVFTTADKSLLQDLIKPKSRPPTAEEVLAGDLNGDGKLDHKDLVLLMQLLDAP